MPKPPAAWMLARDGRHLVQGSGKDCSYRRELPATLGVSGSAPGVVEITETSVIAEFERSRVVVQDLRDLGVSVSIDDFAAGFTSLAYLSSLAVEEPKIDRALITRLAGGNRQQDVELVRATIALGHALRLRVIAEGIEDSATLDLVSDLGCDLGQGYFIGRPRAAHELAFAPSPKGVPVASIAGSDGDRRHRQLARTA